MLSHRSSTNRIFSGVLNLVISEISLRRTFYLLQVHFTEKNVIVKRQPGKTLSVNEIEQPTFSLLHLLWLHLSHQFYELLLKSEHVAFDRFLDVTDRIFTGEALRQASGQARTFCDPVAIFAGIYHDLSHGFIIPFTISVVKAGPKGIGTNVSDQ